MDDELADLSYLSSQQMALPVLLNGPSPIPTNSATLNPLGRNLHVKCVLGSGGRGVAVPPPSAPPSHTTAVRQKLAASYVDLGRVTVRPRAPSVLVKCHSVSPVSSCRPQTLRVKNPVVIPVRSDVISSQKRPLLLSAKCGAVNSGSLSMRLLPASKLTPPVSKSQCPASTVTAVSSSGVVVRVLESSAAKLSRVQPPTVNEKTPPTNKIRPHAVRVVRPRHTSSQGASTVVTASRCRQHCFQPVNCVDTATNGVKSVSTVSSGDTFGALVSSNQLTVSAAPPLLKTGLLSTSLNNRRESAAAVDGCVLTSARAAVVSSSAAVSQSSSTAELLVNGTTDTSLPINTQGDGSLSIAAAVNSQHRPQHEFSTGVLRPLVRPQQLAAAIQLLAGDTAISWHRSGRGRLPSVDNKSAKFNQVFLNQFGLLELAVCGSSRAPLSHHSRDQRLCVSCHSVIDSCHTSLHCSTICRDLASSRIVVKRERSPSSSPTSPANKRPRTLPHRQDQDTDDEQAVRGEQNQRFSWSRYISALRCHIPDVAAWTGRDRAEREDLAPFSVGHWLETVDPRYPHNICAGRIVDILDCLLCVELDDALHGKHRFWTSRHSPLIYPCGQCERHWSAHTSVRATRAGDSWSGWQTILTESGGEAAPARCFSSPSNNAVKNATAAQMLDVNVGHRLEVAVPEAGGAMSPGRVVAVRGDKVLVRADFSGADPSCQWLSFSSSRLRPIYWASGNNISVKTTPDETAFDWQKYLSTTRSQPAPAHLFSAPTGDRSSSSGSLTPGVRIELLDQISPRKVSVAHIVSSLQHGLVHVAVDGQEDHIWLPADSWRIQPPGWSRLLQLEIAVPRRLSDSVSSSSLSTHCSSDVFEPEAAVDVVMATAEDFIRNHSSDVVSWQPATVQQFVNCFSSHQSALSTAFLDHEVDGESLMLLTRSDLVQHLHVPLGLAVRLHAFLERLRGDFKYCAPDS